MVLGRRRRRRGADGTQQPFVQREKPQALDRCTWSLTTDCTPDSKALATRTGDRALKGRPRFLCCIYIHICDSYVCAYTYVRERRGVMAHAGNSLAFSLSQTSHNPSKLLQATPTWRLAKEVALASQQIPPHPKAPWVRGASE